jgi:drug/metabolite transporter (DMT)-like permease
LWPFFTLQLECFSLVKVSVCPSHPELESNTNVFLFSVAGLLSSGSARAISGSIRFDPTTWNIFFALMCGIFGYGFQYSLGESVRLEKNYNITAIISSSSILFSFALDVVLGGTAFSAWSLFGSIIVFVSVAVIIVKT